MAKTTMSKQSKNIMKNNISLKMPQPAAIKRKTTKPDVSSNTTCRSSYMDVDNMEKTTMGKQSKNSETNIPVKALQPATNIKAEPEIRSHGIWSPYMDGIVGMPKSVAEIGNTEAMINAVLYGLRNTRPLPIFRSICPEDK